MCSCKKSPKPRVLFQGRPVQVPNGYNNQPAQVMVKNPVRKFGKKY